MRLREVASPGGTVHGVGRRLRYGLPTTACGVVIDFVQGWGRTGRKTIECRNCLLAIERGRQAPSIDSLPRSAA